MRKQSLGASLSWELQGCMNAFVLSVSNESETKSSNANSKWILRNLFVGVLILRQVWKQMWILEDRTEVSVLHGCYRIRNRSPSLVGCVVGLLCAPLLGQTNYETRSTRLTSDANDFVIDKSHAREKPLLAGRSENERGEWHFQVWNRVSHPNQNCPRVPPPPSVDNFKVS